MARNDRKGERKERNQRNSLRVPELGYYLIVTDTKCTEQFYFTGLQADLPDDIKKKLVVKVVETNTASLIDKCVEYTAYDPQYRVPWIVFDRDRVKDFDKIIMDAQNNDLNVGWSNPCFEIWMYAYFGSMPNIQDSWTCCHKFGELYKTKTGVEYNKAEEKIYQKLTRFGDEMKAIKIAKRTYEACKENYSVPSQMCPCTTVYELVEEIRNKGLMK